MRDNDDYEYYDDDEYYDEEDEEYIDYDEDDDASSSSLRGSIRPFGSGSSSSSGGDRDQLRSRLTGATSGGSRFGSSNRLPGSTPYGRSRSDDDDEDSSSSSGTSRFGGSSSSSRFGSGSSGSSRLPGSTPYGRSKSDDDDKSSSSGSSRFGGSSSSSRFGSGSSGSSRLPGSTPYGRSRSDDDDKGSSSGSSRFGSSSGSSRYGGSSSSSDKKDDKKDSGSSSGGRFGGIGNRFGGGSKDDKKDSGSSSGGRFGGIGNRLGGGSRDDKKDDKKDSGSSSGSRLGGLGNRFGGGSKDDKKDDKKDSGSSGGGLLSGLSNPFGGGSKDDKKDDKKDSGSSGGGLLSGLSNPFGGGSKDDKKDDKKDSGSSGGSRSSAFGSGSRSPSSSSSSSTSSSSRSGGFGSRLGGGSSSSDKKDDKPRQSAFGRTRSASAQSASDEKSSGGIGARIGGLFGRGGDDKSSSSSSRSRRTERQRASKVPQANTEDGLTLDNWLDILGVGLVFFSLVLFFSAISQEQAAIAAIHTFLGQLFGWGALGVPIAMFAIGMWLIIRHFGDDAPTVDPIRVAGVALGYVTLLVLFQYFNSFQYEVPGNITTMDLLQQWLEARVRYSWEVEQAGGGLVGAQIYLFMYNTITEIGGFVLMIFLALVSAMLITRLTAAEILRAIAGVWLSMREGVKQQAEKRRIERQLAAQQAAELQAQQAQTATESASAAPEAAPTAQPAAAAEGNFEGREIRISSGGQFSTLNPATAQASSSQNYAPPPPPQQHQQNNGRRGLGGVAAAMGGLLSLGGSSNKSAPPPPPMPSAPLPMDDGYTHFDGEGNGGQAPQQPAATSEPSPMRMGDMLSPPEEAPAPETPAASAESAPTAQPSQDVDPVKARQERLDALRRGEAGPLSQSSLAEARRQGVVAQAGPSDVEPEQVVRDRERAKLQEQEEFVPPSQLPSAQPDGNNEPKQQRLSTSPVSSGVQNQTRPKINWRTPEYRTLLSSGGDTEFDREELLRQANIIEDTLQAFGAPGRVVEVNTGPVITQFGVEPDYITGRGGKKQRVKVSAMAALDKDMQLALGARSIRVEAPVPGKGYVGIEVPNKDSALVSLRDVLDSPSFQKIKSPLAIALGQSVSGAPVSADLASMPHLLIAGTTGSGKSVCVNSIIASLLVRNTPEQVKFIMVDPKRVELTGYNGVPHLVAPVVVDLERIVGVLKWVTREMDARYKKFSERGSRNIVDYNNHIDPKTEELMPYLVVIIDELADLMMLAPEETERTVTRIAALARATGIHLVIATQRPSVDVVTGLIKANFPARIAFAVAGSVDSRVILDQPGAERLLGKGDMLYLSGNSPAPLRMQGVFLSDIEINNITRYWKMQAMKHPAAPAPEPLPLATSLQPEDSAKEVMPRGDRVHQQAFWDAAGNFDDDDSDSDVELTEGELTGDHEGSEDELYEKAVELVRRLDKASISLLQRRLRIGYTRAARLIDMMEARGVIGPAKEGSSKPRDVLKSTP